MNPTDLLRSFDSSLGDVWSPYSAASIFIPLSANEDEFKQRARLMAYQQLLSRMFGTNFECVAVSGGFSGSSVVKITPFDRLGNREESVIVKLDSALNIRIEVAHSMQAQAALGDIAARVLGEPIYLRSDTDGLEYGGFKMELAGAVLQVPELSSTSAESPMINTFKDLVVFESEEVLLGKAVREPDCVNTLRLRGVDSDSEDDCRSADLFRRLDQAQTRPFGSTSAITKELFGQDGSATRSLRRFEESASSVSRRISASDPNHPSGADFLLSRLPSLLVPSVEVVRVLEAMGLVVPTLAGADPYSLVNDAMQSVKSSLKNCPTNWRVLRGFCHGDLNGSNIIIDAMEGMWLIDFATARKLPLASDLAKLEACLLFEYAFVPLPVQLLAAVCEASSVGLTATWLKIEEHVLDAFLSLSANVSVWTDETLNRLVLQLVDDFPIAQVRSLRARLTCDELGFRESLKVFSTAVVETLIPKGNVFESVAQFSDHRKALAANKTFTPELSGVQQVLFAVEKLRQYCFSDIEKLFRTIHSEDLPGGLFDWDVSCVEFCVVLLREAARVVRYTDVPPWTKLVVGQFAKRLADSVATEVIQLQQGLNRVELPPVPIVLSMSRSVTPEAAAGDTDVFDHSATEEAHSGAPPDEDTAVYLSGRLADELKKYAKHMKAKYGYLTDFVSGRQLDVVAQCCPFRLISVEGGSSFTEQELVYESDRAGWIVQGVPGSGKSCLLRRLVMAVISSGLLSGGTELTGLVPIFLSVADWVKVIASDSQCGQNQCCLEMFLRAIFVDDDVRLRLLRFCLAKGRAVLLIDGLDDAAAFPQIRDCLDQKAKRGIKVIATSVAATLGLGFRGVSIAPLDRDQRRAIVRSRLDAVNLEKFEAFFDVLQQSSVPFDVDQGALIKSPAFVSMLLCYWTNLAAPSAVPAGSDLERQSTRRIGGMETPPLTRMLTASVSGSAANDAEMVPLVRATSPVTASASPASLVDVYRVAVSVLVHRYQMFLESDRSKVREAAKRLTDLLRLIAFSMKLNRVIGVRAEVLLGWLGPDLTEATSRLLERVRQGKFLLLTYSISSGEYRFCLSGLLDVLAAEHLIHDPNCFEIPVALNDLIGESWWLPPLAILADKAPLKYVRLIERKLLAGVGAGVSETCLHVAARAGHWPLFKVLTKSSLLESLVQRPNAQSLLPLHEAARSSSSSAAVICKALILAKADVWATTNEGWCALHYAASFHNREVCSALLSDARATAGSYNQLPRMPRQQLARLSAAGLSMASKILKKEMTSDEFVATAKLVFPELSYFRGRSDTTPDASASVSLEPAEIEFRRTLGAMLSVFWIVADDYDSFVANQGLGNRLSRSSWALIQDWARNDVELTTPEAVDAMLSLMAIHDLGKLKDFRNDLASDFKDHDAAMRFIIATTPEVLPSLCRLPDRFQQTVKSALSVDFNFGQFLQSENLPANLVAIKDLFAKQGQHTLALYLLHIFADMAGIMGAVNLGGSLFMTETMYGNFDLGIRALSRLNSAGVAEVYDSFLSDRAMGQALPFIGQEPGRSIVRLACLSRIFDSSGGRDLSSAWSQLPTSTQDVLVKHLARTGLEPKQTAYLLYYAPAFMDNARRTVGLKEAMEFLARLYLAAESEFAHSHVKACIVIHVAEAAEVAKRATVGGSLRNVCFRIFRSAGSRKLSEATVRISPWRLGAEVTTGPVEAAVKDLKRYREVEFLGLPVPQRIQTLLALVANDHHSFGHKCPLKLFADLAVWVRHLLVADTDVELAFVVVTLAGLNNLTQLKMDLGMPHASVAEMLKAFPSVFPSFARLGQNQRELVLAILSIPFLLEQVVNGERMTVHAIERLAQLLTSPLHRAVFVVYSLVASEALSESYVNVFRFTAGLVLRNVPAGLFVDDLIKFRGEHQGLGHTLASPRQQVLSLPAETQTIIKIACLARVHFATGGCLVQAAFANLSSNDRSRIAQFLNRVEADNLSKLMTACKLNCRVGLDQALAVVLEVAAYMDSHGCDRVDFSGLVARAERHAVALPFKSLALSFTSLHGGVHVTGKVLIPVSDDAVLQTLSVGASNFTAQVSEHDLVSVYPELDAFSLTGSDSVSPDSTGSAFARRTTTAITSLIHIVTNRYESFTRSQQSNKLTVTSWMEIRDWICTVLANPEALDAVIVYLVIVGVARVTGASISTHPQLFPSFQRLSWKFRSLIERSMACGSIFGQFLQAENLPLNLEALQQFARSNGSFGLQFYLAFVLAQQCGLLDESRFMTNDNWSVFNTGRSVVGEIEYESLHCVYAKYLLRRAGVVLSSFRDRLPMMALARLCCLARVSSERDAKILEVSFDEMAEADSDELVQLLCRGVCDESQGVVITYLPALMENMKRNASVPVSGHLQVLLEILRAANNGDRREVSAVDLAHWARDVQVYEPTFFSHVRLCIEEDSRLRLL